VNHSNDIHLILSTVNDSVWGMNQLAVNAIASFCKLTAHLWEITQDIRRSHQAIDDAKGIPRRMLL
jgi:hypothetical protein